MQWNQENVLQTEECIAKRRMQWKHENIEESGECSGNMRMQRNQENVMEIKECSGNEIVGQLGEYSGSRRMYVKYTHVVET